MAKKIATTTKSANEFDLFTPAVRVSIFSIQIQNKKISVHLIVLYSVLLNAFLTKLVH